MKSARSDFVKDRGGSGGDRETSTAGNAKRLADFRPRCRMTFYFTTKTSGEKISGHLAKESEPATPQLWPLKICKRPPGPKCPLLWSLLGVKRTWLFAAQMSAYDPKRTFD
jgi:hypothetical protein